MDFGMDFGRERFIVAALAVAVAVVGVGLRVRKELSAAFGDFLIWVGAWCFAFTLIWAWLDFGLPWIPIGVAIVFGTGGVVACWRWSGGPVARRFYGNPCPSVEVLAPESEAESLPLDDLDLLAHLLVEHHGEEEAKAVVLRAQERCQSPAAKDDDEAVPIPVVAKRIRREPNRTARHLERLGFADISRLAQKLFDPGLQQMAEANRAADSFAEAARHQMPNFGELARQQMPSFSDLAKEENPQVTDLIKDDEED